MEEAFRALLLGVPSIGLPRERINFGIHPQGLPFPGIVLTVVDNAQGLTLSGGDGLWQGRVQVDCYALAAGDAKKLSRAVIAQLADHHDEGFQGIFLMISRDYHETSATDRPFRVSLEFSTHWSE